MACGDEEPMDGYHTFPDAWRKGADTLYEVDIPHIPFPPPSRHAVQLLRQLLHEATRPVTILTLGPLTNIAQLVEEDARLTANIDELVIMGGAVRVQGNLLVPGVTEYITNRVAEWDLFVDPVAAQRVFRSDVPIVLVPLDATNQIQVTRAFTADFKKRAQTKEAHFIDAIFDKNSGFVDSGEYYFWDPLASAVVADRSLCRYETLHLEMLLAYSEAPPPTGHGFSTTRADGLPRRHFAESVTGQTVISDNGSPAQVCTQVDEARFRQEFFRTINHEASNVAR